MVKFASVPAVILALALAASADAQEKPVTTLKEREQTLRVVVSGRIVLDAVYRSAGVTFATEGFSAADDLAPAPPQDNSDSESTFEGHVAIRLDVELSDRISLVVEVGTRRVDGGAVNEWGNAAAEPIQLREARVTATDLLAPGLKAEAGIPSWSFDVRGRGNSFAFDPRHSSTIAKNVDTESDNSDAFFDRSGNGTAGPNELQVIGAVMTWTCERIQVDLVLLPSVVEGGNPTKDEALYAIDLWYDLGSIGKGNRVGGIFAVSALDITSLPSFTPPPPDASGSNTALYTLGGGIDLREIGVPGLELYVEAYFQFGDVGKVDVSGTADADDIDADGYALQLGSEYHATTGNPMPWWVAANLTYLSGDDSPTVGPSATDDTNSRFLSYENINDLLVLEDMYFGFDWDTNYIALKISSGVTLTVGSGKDNLDLSVILGITRTAEDVLYSSNGVTVTAKEDKLGNEVDVRARFHLNRQVSFHAALGLLFGSEVLEESMNLNNVPIGTDAEDSAQVFVLGTDMRF